LIEALARAEREVWERAGLIETMRAELVSLNDALAQPRREVQDRLGEVARLESELAGLREAMEETERETIGRAKQEAEARALEAARLEREMAGLREAVRQPQREAEQSAAAAKSLEGELAATQAALAAARQVGRDAINALAMGKPAPLERALRLGWRQAVRRVFGFAAGA
jgi:predicted  nucleic acid-binding Zn-ribbon protein